VTLVPDPRSDGSWHGDASARPMSWTDWIIDACSHLDRRWLRVLGSEPGFALATRGDRGASALRGPISQGES